MTCIAAGVAGSTFRVLLYQLYVSHAVVTFHKGQRFVSSRVSGKKQVVFDKQHYEPVQA